ncbi:hypothetical protein TSUD_349360 [Trifolium subterraneum]|uniref:Copper amine oxidase N2-terminal domain-containing protein n=1 Tax=Trifolium subterraneum TaxID=3900 RepID=A0A2Z6NY12_TRISU|nr:hypothetical protein TSUD_349360 [Trifolium subterraneum]
MASTTIKFALFSALTLLSLQTIISITPLHFQHPLDPLTKEEYFIVQKIVLHKYPKVAFHYIGLDDPEKDDILRWESFKPSVITIPRKVMRY